VGTNAQLSGTYTIDPNGNGSRNFTTITNAVSTLDSFGVNDEVVFEIANGIYNESLSFVAIRGASSLNSIVFKSKSLDSSKVLVRSSSSTTLLLNGAKHVSFTDISFENASSGVYYNVLLTNGADSNSFSNCAFKANYSGNFGYNVYLGNSSGNNLAYCNVYGGYYGLVINGSFSYGMVKGNGIYYSKFIKQYNYGAYLNLNDSVSIRNCSFDSLVNSRTGILLYVANSNQIFGYNNSLFSGGYGVLFTGINTLASSPIDSFYWVNNMMGGAYQYGLYMSNVAHARVLNNTMYFNSSYQSGYGVYVYLADGHTWFNNNISINSAYNGFYLYGPNGYEPDDFDYNNLYIKAAQQYAYYLTTSYSNFLGLQNGNPAYHQRSVNVDPDFDSKINLRSYVPGLNNAGTNVGLAKDYDGKVRPARGDTLYDIGCNEFALSSYDLDVVEITSPLTVSSKGNVISAVFKNRGTQDIINQQLSFAYITEGGNVYESELVNINSIKSGDIYSYTFTKKWNPSSVGNFNLRVLIDGQVQGDPDSLDAIDMSICSGLKGFYTVDPLDSSSNNFKSINGALSALQCGVDSHTVIEIANGTYTQNILLENIPGLGKESTLTIKGEKRDSVIINHQANSFTQGANVHIHNLEHITISDLSLVAANSNYAQGVRISGSAEHIQVLNCKMQCGNSTNIQSAGIAVHGYSNAFVGANARNLNFGNNSISGFGNGIYILGTKTQSRIKSVVIDSNAIAAYQQFGIYAFYSDSLAANANSIQNARSDNAMGIVLEEACASSIIGNKVNGYGIVGIGLYEENDRTSKSSILVNNMVFGASTYTSIYEPSFALEITGSRNVKVINNSLVFNSKNNPYNNSGVDYVPSCARLVESTELELLNNIFVNNSTSSRSATLVNNKSSFTEFDFNTYWSETSQTLAFDGIAIASLTNWQNIRPAYNARSFEQKTHFQNGNEPFLNSKQAPLRGKNNGLTIDIDGNSRCGFAPCIGAHESSYTTPKPRVFFAANDTIYLNSPTTFYNAASVNDASKHNWFVDGKLFSNELHFDYTFNNTGTYSVKLLTENCGGIDSFSKQVIVAKAWQKPSVEFIASESEIKKGQVNVFTNLTENGAESFEWEIRPYWFYNQKLSIMQKAFEFVNGTDSTSKNPQIEFLNPGEYSVCLKATNAIGADSLCKVDYILVLDEKNICESNYSTNLSGHLFDPAGELENYSATQTYKCAFLIEPCANNLKVYFNVFELSIGDRLRIYDGIDSTGNPLHNYDNFYSTGLTGSISASQFKDTLYSKSGRLYVEFETYGGQSAPGFDMVWEGKTATGLPPVASFSMPDTVCENILVNAQNTSAGFGNKYTWTVTRDNAAYNDSTFAYAFAKRGVYKVKLAASNCFGVSFDSMNLVVIRPNKAPQPSFDANTYRPKVGFPTQLLDKSSYDNFECADNWQWQISPSTFSFISGTNASSQNPVIVFQDTGCYSVKLVVGNAFGKDSITRNCYFNAIQLCAPSVAFLNSDIAISRVQLNEIDNRSLMAQRAYTDYSLKFSTELQIGADYFLVLHRDGNRVNQMQKAIWIDLNQDGDFDEKTEKIASAGPDYKAVDTLHFQVPKGITGPTTLRIGVNIGSKPNLACGPNQFGEYEDYTVYLTPDLEAPVVYFDINGKLFKSKAKIQLEQCAKVIRPTSFAIDNVDDSIAIDTIIGRVKSGQVGVYELLFKAYDKSLNEGVGVLQVEIVGDTSAPNIEIIGLSLDSVQVFASYTDLGAKATDNCSSGLVVEAKSTLDTSRLGNYSITYSSIDNAKNLGISIRDVVVFDSVKPMINSLKGKDTIVLEVNDRYTEPGIIYSDNYYSENELVIKTVGEVLFNKIGEYVLEYTVIDPSGNVSITKSRVVKVVDTQSPVLYLVGGDTVEIDVFDKYYDWGIKMFDNYNMNSELGVIVKGSFIDSFGANGVSERIGFYNYSYIVSDKSGNKDSITRVISVLDNKAPSIVLNGLPVLVIQRWSDFNDPGARVIDNYWGGNGVWYTSKNNVNTQSNGTYYAQYCPFDSSGNAGECILRYIVVEEGVEFTNSINNGSSIQVEVFPNPASDFIMIKVAEKANLSIFNANGKLILNQRAENQYTIVNTTNWSSGVYLLRVQLNNEVLNTKIRVLK
jgi:PKD repeat protein